jgi:CBS domain-containing protein
MTEEFIAPHQSQDGLEEHLEQVQALLARQKLVEELVHRQGGPRQDLVENLVHKQNLAELQKKLEELHPADVAYILEALPMQERLQVWELVKAERDGEILLEASDAVRESLIARMDNQELLAAAGTLDTDEIADLAPDLPKDVIQELLTSLDAQKRSRLQSALSYPEDQVGALMDFEMVTIRADVTLEVALRYLRGLGELPDQLDKLFVVERDEKLIGVLPLKRLLTSDPDATVAAVMAEDAVSFQPEDDAHEASQAFERYDLVMAPVVDSSGRLLGRLTVDAVVDYIRQSPEADMLSMAGLKEEEDIYATVWKAAKNRWTWLAINLCTALLASPRGGRLRRPYLKASGTGGVDAHRRRHGRQLRQPDFHPGGTRSGPGADQQGQRQTPASQGTGHLPTQRLDVGSHHGSNHLSALPQCVPEHGYGCGHAAQPGGGRTGGLFCPRGHSSVGARSRLRQRRAPHLHH